jgi:hypothetical protein
MENSKVSDLLKKIYYDARNPASFSSVEKLLTAARLEDKSVKRNDVTEWLKSQKVYTLHRPKRRNFVRNHVVATAVDEVWQADLVDMQAFRSVNKGYGYILTMVDVISKFAHAVPLKTKHGNVVAEALASVFEDRAPSHLHTDQGKEFTNPSVQKVLQNFGVHYYTTKDEDIKCSLVERFNRTLRARMFRYFTHKGSYQYTDVLKLLIDSYNNTEHSSTGMRPVDVDDADGKKIFKKLYGYESRREMMLAAREKSKKTIPVGASVRIKYREKLMDKGYYPSWSDEIFYVDKVIKDTGSKVMYILKDHEGEVIEGRFYPEEVQEIKDDTYRVDVLKTRIRRGVKECFVHWIGYPSSQDQWIKESDLYDNDD